MLYPSKYVNIIINRRIWDTQKNTEAEEKLALKREEPERKIKRNKDFPFMKSINNVRFITLWIFIVPLIAINLCLYITTQLHHLINSDFWLFNAFPYIDGQASISRVARFFPNYLIFKPAMFLTSYLLVKYWLYNREIIKHIDDNHKYIRKFFFFGIASAVMLTLHSIFLGIKIDYDIYKLFRRVVLLSFIIFEVVAQTYLVLTLNSLKNKLSQYINYKILKIKITLVILLIAVGLLSIPIVTMPGNKFLKHALEWDYFLGVTSFYLLTFFMWKKNK
jgi:hypothetical protein